jgi:hypothetical protein
VRTLLILVFAVASIWLLTERMRLTEQVTALEEQIKKKDADLEDYTKQQPQRSSMRPIGGTALNPGGATQPIAPPPKAGWINDHIDKGARSLDAPKGIR